mmetsp:Transcript_87718/g.246437  ORF Transcript_87718/g.246437 Transcript_87718/m.246437 type:complete len:307 (-) Transcript_87718:372-1292(-)
MAMGVDFMFPSAVRTRSSQNPNRWEASASILHPPSSQRHVVSLSPLVVGTSISIRTSKRRTFLSLSTSAGKSFREPPNADSNRKTSNAGATSAGSRNASSKGHIISFSLEQWQLNEMHPAWAAGSSEKTEATSPFSPEMGSRTWTSALCSAARILLGSCLSMPRSTTTPRRQWLGRGVPDAAAIGGESVEGAAYKSREMSKKPKTVPNTVDPLASAFGTISSSPSSSSCSSLSSSSVSGSLTALFISSSPPSLTSSTLTSSSSSFSGDFSSTTASSSSSSSSHSSKASHMEQTLDHRFRGRLWWPS